MVAYPNSVTGNLTVTGTLRLIPGAAIQLGADVNIYRPSADVLQTDDYFVMPNGQANGSFTAFGGTPGALVAGTAGGGLAIKEGANARSGVATLVAGTVVVANTSVTATTRVQLTIQSLGTVTAPKAIGVTARSAGVSFTITSADATDTSVVGWHLIEPA